MKFVENSPVFDEFLVQLQANPAKSIHEEGVIDVLKLWRSAGSPPDKHPDQYLADSDESTAVRQKRADEADAILLSDSVAFRYAGHLDVRISNALEEAFAHAAAADPPRFMIGDPDAPTSKRVVAAVMKRDGVNEEEAVKRILSAVASKIRTEDPYRQETLLARAQRALENDSSVPISPIDTPAPKQRSVLASFDEKIRIATQLIATMLHNQGIAPHEVAAKVKSALHVSLQGRAKRPRVLKTTHGKQKCVDAAGVFKIVFDHENVNRNDPAIQARARATVEATLAGAS